MLLVPTPRTTSFALRSPPPFRCFYRVCLNYHPGRATIVVSILPDKPECTIMPKSLVFDKDSWNVEQVVFVQAIDDESGKSQWDQSVKRWERSGQVEGFADS